MFTDAPPFLLYFFCGFLAFITFIVTVSACFIGFKKIVTVEITKKENQIDEEEIEIPEDEKIF